MLLPICYVAHLVFVLTLPTISLCDVIPHFPYDPATTPYCTWWIDNDSTISCTEFLNSATYRVISITDFIRWNPFVTPMCGNFAQWTSYCVEAFNEPSLVTTWNDLGCYIDNANTHTLGNSVITGSEKLTRNICKAECQRLGYTYAGVEDSQNCWCDAKLNGLPASSDNPTQCNLACKGNNSEICGGHNRIDVFQLITVLVYSTTSTSTSSLTRTTFSIATTTTKTGISTVSVSTTTSQPSAVSTWIPLGCYTDTSTPRTLGTIIIASTTLTVEACKAGCANGGWLYAGVEFGSQCWCDSEIRGLAANPVVAASECNMACSGNSAQTCGAAARIDVYYAVRVT